MRKAIPRLSVKDFALYLLEHSNKIHSLERDMQKLSMQMTELVTSANNAMHKLATRIEKLEGRVAEFEQILIKQKENKVVEFN